ncbi:MAG: alpha/beta fold hydrolase [Limimaricola sp.]|uniref:alpha/beta hydrolase n=1 Tax=Limimaricola sp. TaxID=2211665 RepID=UPI001E17698B|nr:alpha/beta fold hydrolase [Limimaricola sp.]MBI1416125.1 alpha/beta fold hydrolase [Limimaricola sp.]
MIEDISFPSEGAALRGRFYGHPRGGRAVVVMTHGTSATITMVTDRYAEAIHAAGFDVLLYDHRNFGRSGGEPRHEINPWLQARGYRDAVAWLREERGAGRVALWGDSYSAMVVLVAAALIDDIAAVVAQIPACGISMPPVAPSDEVRAQMRAILQGGDISGGPAQTTGPLPVVSADQLNAPSLLAPIQAYRWFIEFGGRFGTGWENCATRVVPATPVPFHPALTAPYLTMPVQMMVGREDEMVHCNPAVQRAVFDAIPGDKEFREIDGGHFGLLWYPGPLFDEAVQAQTAFLGRVLR